MKYLFILLILLGILLASNNIPPKLGSSAYEPTPTPISTPTPTPLPPSSGSYCMSKNEFEQILTKNADLICCGREWVKVVDNAVVTRKFIHNEKQLIPKDDPHENPSQDPPNCKCDDPFDEVDVPVQYYSWLCHPPSWGSIWNNTLWRLNDPNPNRDINDGDNFTVYLLKTANLNDPLPFICRAGSGYYGYTSSYIMKDFLVIADDGIIQVGQIYGKYASSNITNVIHLEAEPPDGTREKFGEITYKGSLHDAYFNLIAAYAPDKQYHFYLVEHNTVETATETSLIPFYVFDILPEGPNPIQPKTPKLDTFKPIPPTLPPTYYSDKPWYDVYLPESAPVLYLYPQQTIKANVKVLPKEGYITISEPLYDPVYGWRDITAFPDGRLTYKNKDYSSLYFETEVKGYRIPEEGFVISKSDAEDFFREKLGLLGLNDKETADFLDYWVKRINKEVKKPYLFINFLSQNDINNIIPLDINPAPDYLLRIRMYIKPTEERFLPPLQILVKPQPRYGFAAIEWGGILDE